MGIQCDSQHRVELALFLPAKTGMGVAGNAAAVVVDLAVDPPPHTLQPQSSADAVALPGLGQLRRRFECGDSDAKPSLIKVPTDIEATCAYGDFASRFELHWGTLNPTNTQPDQV